jgi:transposase
MIDAERDAAIRRLFFAEHWPVGTISAQLGVHRDVVRRVAGLDSPQRVVPAPTPTRVGPFEAFITQTLQQYPRLRATRLFDMVQDRGYTGSVRTLREYVARVRPAPAREVFLTSEVLPGEQAQVDWAQVGLRPVPGGQRALWVFVMVLAYSRMLWLEFVWDLTVASLRRSLLRAHTFFGGSVRRWLFDNPRCVVIERKGRAVRFHPTLLELAGALHVEPSLCTPYSPQQKGRVERAVRYVRERLLDGRTILDVDAGNAAAASFLREIAPARRHPTRRDQTVAQVFAQEKERLLVLPDPMPSLEQVLPVVPDKTASVHFDTNVYSVAPEAAEGRLVLSADDRIVRVFLGEREVACHARCWGRGQRIEAPSHREAIVALKRGGADLKGRDRLRHQIPAIEALLARWAEDGRNLGNAVGRTIQRLDLYGADAMRAAVTEAVARGLRDPAALETLCERHRRGAPDPATRAPHFGAHVVDRDVLPHDLGGYDE